MTSWPTIPDDAILPECFNLKLGDPWPTCILIGCENPARTWVSFIRLDSFTGTSGFYCDEHLHHAAESGERWVTWRDTEQVEL